MGEGMLEMKEGNKEEDIWVLMKILKFYLRVFQDNKIEVI